MTLTPTPGQVAHAAFWANVLPAVRGDPWETLYPLTQARWDAAAQAVRAWQEEESDGA